jgi:uncharacterized protein YajQ (UPF0234 family)
LGLFEGKEAKERKSHFRNLVVLSMVDGVIRENELKFLFVLGRRLKLSEKDIKSVLKSPDKIKFTPPTDPKERFSQLFDLIAMMMIDRHVDRREMDFCMTIASGLGFRPTVVQELVNKIVKAITESVPKERLSIEVANFLD